MQSGAEKTWVEKFARGAHHLPKILGIHGNFIYYRYCLDTLQYYFVIINISTDIYSSTNFTDGEYKIFHHRIYNWFYIIGYFFLRGSKYRNLPAHLVLLSRIQIQVEYHLLLFLLVAQSLRGRRIKFRPPVVLNRPSHLVILYWHLSRPVPFLILILRDVGDRVNIQHDAERLRFTLLRIIIGIRNWTLV